MILLKDVIGMEMYVNAVTDLRHVKKSLNMKIVIQYALIMKIVNVFGIMVCVNVEKLQYTVNNIQMLKHV